MSQAAAIGPRIIPSTVVLNHILPFYHRFSEISKTAHSHFERNSKSPLPLVLDIYKHCKFVQKLDMMIRVTALTKEICLRGSVGCFSILTTPIIPPFVGLLYLGSHRILHKQELSQNLKMVNAVFYLTFYRMPKEMISYGIKSKIAPFLASLGLKLGIAYLMTHLFHKILQREKRFEKQVLDVLLSKS